MTDHPPSGSHVSTATDPHTLPGEMPRGGDTRLLRRPRPLRVPGAARALDAARGAAGLDEVGADIADLAQAEPEGPVTAPAGATLVPGCCCRAALAPGGTGDGVSRPPHAPGAQGR